MGSCYIPFPRPRSICTLPYLSFLDYCFYADEGEKKLILVPGVVNSETDSLVNYTINFTLLFKKEKIKLVRRLVIINEFN